VTRPPFAKDYPPELDELLEAFERGNYASVREGTGKLSRESKDEKVKAAAADLRSRTEADPMQKILLVIVALLLVGLGVYWWAHQQAPGTPREGAPVARPPASVEIVK
jgi:hypothetical protein